MNLYLFTFKVTDQGKTFEGNDIIEAPALTLKAIRTARENFSKSIKESFNVTADPVRDIAITFIIKLDQ